MNRMQFINYCFAIGIAILIGVLSWGGYVFYNLQLQGIKSKTELAIKQTAKELQYESVTVLNNLAAVMNDEDFKSKAAFAAGITGNMGKMREWFDEEGELVNQQLKKQNENGETVPNIDTVFLKKNKITPNSKDDKSIQYFDSLFRIELKENKLDISFSIHKQTARDTIFNNPAFQFSSPVFIINFYDPKVYRVDYNIPVIEVMRGIVPYSIISSLLLMFLVAAFVFMKRSYGMQTQMATFRETLFSNITHELKTPVTSLQLILESTCDNKPLSSEHIRFAKTELNRMKLIIDKILSFAKMNKEQFELNRELLDMNTVIQDALSAMSMAIDQYGAKIEYSSTADCKIIGDKVLLTNTIVTMIDNALKYNKNTPHIYIDLFRNENKMQLKVADNGIGVAPDFYKKIFTPFFRIPTGDVYNVKGHGLGLSFAAQVMELHNGNISVSSNANGSAFIINLPIT